MFKFMHKTLLTALFAAFASQASAMFIQADWYDPTQPGVGTNRYAYSGNDPINNFDPSGHYYEGYYHVYPTIPYDTHTPNPVLRGLNNTAIELLNTPSSVGNLAADALYGTGELIAPYSDTLTNMAVTTPTAFDDLGAGAVSGWTKLSTSVAERAMGLKATFANPADLRFSQITAGGGGRADAIRKSMAENGWNGPAVDVVQTPSGSLVTIDNTRVAVTRELGITKIPVNIRKMDETLPEGMAGRFPGATTWGDALRQRTSSNGLGGEGSANSPRMPGAAGSANTGGFGGWLSNLFK